MNAFDIIGPVMVGPSSSHTAGVTRIGLVTRKLLGERPVKAVIYFHGSLAKTHRGHGSDKAIIGGLLGFDTDDLRIRNSLEIAKQEGLAYDFQKIELSDVHPNTLIAKVEGESGKRVEVLASSIGAGAILVKRFNGTEVEFTGDYNTIVIHHHDTPGMIAAVAQRFQEDQINIANMRVYRSKKHGDAFMIIEIDQDFPKGIEERMRGIEGISEVMLLEAVQ